MKRAVRRMDGRGNRREGLVLSSVGVESVFVIISFMIPTSDAFWILGP